MAKEKVRFLITLICTGCEKRLEDEYDFIVDQRHRCWCRDCDEDGKIEPDDWAV